MHASTHGLPAASWLLVLLAACGSTSHHEPVQARGAAGHHPERQRSVTVYPVQMNGRPDAKVAEAVGILLERGGLQDVELAGASFPLDAAAFRQQAEAFGRAVAGSGLRTDYALLAAFDLSPKNGVTEVRGALVAADGTVVWSDRQHPGDAAFDRIKPDCPMTSSVLLLDRLQQPLQLEDPARAGAPEGPLARRFREASLIPTDAERQAMERRLAALKQRQDRPTVLVHPARVGQDWCDESAARLAAEVSAGGRLRATAAAAPLPFTATMDRNQQKVLWSAARSIQEQVRRARPQTDYVLVADYYLPPQGGKAGAVHTFLLNADGEFVIVDFQNSHHADFQSVAPASRQQCCELSALRVRGFLEQR